MGLARKASGAPQDQPPPGGWPGGSWGFVFAADGSGHAVEDSDVLIEFSNHPDTYDAGSPFTNALGGQAALGQIAGDAVWFGSTLGNGTDPRWIGRIVYPTSSSWFTYRLSVPGPGDYEIYGCISTQHNGPYSMAFEVNADGGAWTRTVDLASNEFIGHNLIGNGYNADSLWIAAEATDKHRINGVTGYIEFRMNSLGGSYGSMSSVRVYEV